MSVMECLEGAINVGREAVDGGDSFAGAHVTDMGCEAADRDNTVAAARVLDVGRIWPTSPPL